MSSISNPLPLDEAKIQIIGIAKWLCPDCGHISQDRWTPAQPNLLRCRYKRCGHQWLHSSTFISLASVPETGKALAHPIDAVLPSVTIDRTTKLRPGVSVNRVIRGGQTSVTMPHVTQRRKR